MNVFGWTITISPSVTRQQRRADRNAAAMTRSVGMAALPGQTAAARIHVDEIALAVSILRAAESRQWSLKLHGKTVHDLRPNEFDAELQTRLGAAGAVEPDPKFAPILPAEIDQIQHAIEEIVDDYPSFTWLIEPGRSLLQDLRMRFGHAEAVQYLGTIPVLTDRTLPALEPGADAVVTGSAAPSPGPAAGSGAA
jgi:hypothetical protein